MAGGNMPVTVRTFISICLLLCSAGFVAAQEVMSSNATSDLPPPGTARFVLNGSEIEVPSIKLMPLTRTLALLSQNEFQNFNMTGNLVNINPSNTNTIKDTDLAYISCDDSAYPGNLKASNVISMAAANLPQPQAIILYSTLGNHCNFTFQGGFQYNAIFTTTDPMVAQSVSSLGLNHSSPGNAIILPDMSAVNTNNTGNNGTNNGSSTSDNNVLGPSPTTAVAMIILYSITGIITALFLIIIITGAIRAHRHPERYGPRNALGRPRQSRAKGIARAMLETLPIVKFGDHENVKSPQSGNDVELGSTSAETAGANNQVSDPVNESTAGPRRSVEAGLGGALPEATPAYRKDGSHEDGTLGCSICTEDFNRGEEVRVLPCNHKFHPECVDPWLLNVSGTCPLCRVDLRPPPAEVSEVNEDGTPIMTDGIRGETVAESSDATNLAPPLLSEEPGRRGSRLSDYLVATLNPRRMRDATPEERILALRRLRTANRANTRDAEPSRLPSDAEDRSTSSRLRDRFRMRTRRQGADHAPEVPTVVEEPPSTTDMSVVR